MEQIFKALPRDLQWEILSVFVGTHVVRNGKLMRKMTGETQMRLLNTMRNMGGLYIKQHIYLIPIRSWLAYDGTNAQCQICGRWCICFNTKFLLLAKHNMYVYLFTKTDNKCDIMSYRYLIFNRDYLVTIDNSVVLQPFVKHDYPSYPYTNKKMGILSNKMRLYNPIPEN
jgi:hypothetical protein